MYYLFLNELQNSLWPNERINFLAQFNVSVIDALPELNISLFCIISSLNLHLNVSRLFVVHVISEKSFKNAVYVSDSLQ